MDDICFDGEGQRFLYRVAGVAVRDGRVLIHSWESGDGLRCTPGGRVGFGEGAEEALAREMREELGCEVRLGRLLWVIDNHFTHLGVVTHELGLYYLVEVEEGCEQSSGAPFERVEIDGEQMYFEWWLIAELAESSLRPACLHKLLAGPLPETPVYLLQRDA